MTLAQQQDFTSPAIRRAVLRAMIQFSYDHGKTAPITMKHLKPYFKVEYRTNELSNAVRFLRRRNLIRQEKNHWFLNMNPLDLPRLCFKHGLKDCHICKGEK